MKRIYLPLIFAAFTFLGSDTVKACTCVTSGEPVQGFSVRKWLKQFDGAMFTGRLKEVETVQVKIDKDLTIEMLRVTFEVERYWKGVNSSEAVIHTGAGCCDCGVRYVQGENYFVIADRIEGRLRTSICTAPEKYSDVDGYIKQLGKGKVPKLQKAHRASL